MYKAADIPRPMGLLNRDDDRNSIIASEMASLDDSDFTIIFPEINVHV